MPPKDTKKKPTTPNPTGPVDAGSPRGAAAVFYFLFTGHHATPEQLDTLEAQVVEALGML